MAILFALGFLVEVIGVSTALKLKEGGQKLEVYEDWQDETELLLPLPYHEFHEMLVKLKLIQQNLWITIILKI